MGLPGSGKTTLAKILKKYLEESSTTNNIPSWRLTDMESIPMYYNASVDWFNADEIRKRFNDWDFSRDGRIRQSLRMAEFAFKCNSDYVICDFVAPLPEMRNNFAADWLIWMDTVDTSIYSDTDNIFQAPLKWDFRVTEKNAVKWSTVIGNKILCSN